MLNMVCAIVDDGKLKKPYVVKEVLGGDGSVKSTNCLLYTSRCV